MKQTPPQPERHPRRLGRVELVIEEALIARHTRTLETNLRMVCRIVACVYSRVP